ncbi:MAG: 3'-5' exonuclease [Bacteroidales bacterium]
MINLSIKKEQLAELDLVSFSGKITVLDTDNEAINVFNRLSSERVLGFDTETRPSFKKGQTNKVSLLQISTMTESFLFRLNKLTITKEIIDFMENPNTIKVGLSIKDDMAAMGKSYDFMAANFVELQQMVKDYGILDNSLQKIYAIIFGEKISKNQRLTNWDADLLSEGQRRYAAIDAWSCIKIYNELINNRFKPNDSIYIHLDEIDSVAI